MKCMGNILGGILFFLQGMGQPAHLPATNAYLTSGAYSLHFKDAFSFTSNPACLAEIPALLSGMLAEKKWMLKELSSYALALSIPAGKGGIGIQLQRSGDMLYSEQSGEMAYGKNLGRLETGIRFGYLQVSPSGYPGTGFGFAGIGMRIRVSENIITGWAMDLPLTGGVGKTNTERGEQVFRMGLGYEWGRELFLAFQMVKASGMPVNITGSVAYHYGEQFFFSLGMNSSAGSLVCQSGWAKNHICILLYTAYEPVLGFSPGLVFLWNGKNKKG